MSIRRKALAMAVIALAGCGYSHRSYAILGVGDVVFDPTNFTELVSEVKNGVTQVESLAQIYTNATHQLQMLENVYNMFAHVTNISQLAYALNSAGVNIPMLDDAVKVEAVFRGVGLQTSLAAKIRALVAQTQLYAPQQTDYRSWAITVRANGLAGQIASAKDAYTAAITRSQGLQDLRANVANNDPKAALDLSARASIEVAAAENASGQIASAGLMQSAQTALAREQYEQADRAASDNLIASARAAMRAASSGTVTLVSNAAPTNLTLPPAQ